MNAFIKLFTIGVSLIAGAGQLVLGADALREGFVDPPPEARLRAYWWWLNGNVTRKAITRDLEEMKAKGFGGALICDAGGAEQRGNAQVTHGPTFFTPEWRALYKYTLAEAARLGLEMSLNIQSGWNLGGPNVSADDANKKLVWSEASASGPGTVSVELPLPETRDNYYRDIRVLAYPAKEHGSGGRPALKNLKAKTLQDLLHVDGTNAWLLVNSAPDTSGLLEELPVVPGEEDTQATAVVDLTAKLGADGVLTWEAPEGNWQILRFGCTIGDHAHVSTSSEGWTGYALDPLDAGAFRRYWDAIVEPLIADAGDFAGSTLKYLHTDSWEVDAFNWTPTLIAEFRKRRGYDPLPYFPVLAGRIVDDRDVSNRFLNDFRRTLGDLAVDNHFRLFSQWASRHGLGIHPESGGPHFTAIDAQQCLGINDVPMSEFWAQSKTHRKDDITRFFVKQPASAAHTNGRRFVAAEGFTSIGPHWQETIWDNLKPSFDQALCQGLNRLVWHAFVCSPEEEGLPGIQYFAGTHFNPNTTWWPYSAPFLGYLNRCQYLLSQGLFVADALYFYGDHVPNYTQLKQSDPARVLPGYDYDVIAADALIERVKVEKGRLVLPDGMSYRVLVLPRRPTISLPVLRKIRELVAAGATVVGPKPRSTHSLSGLPQADQETRRLADELWGDASGGEERRVGQGRVVSGRTAREVLLGDGVRPDFEVQSATDTSLDYIHRRTDEADIYFVANRAKNEASALCSFRVSGKVPELWDAVTGQVRDLPAYTVAEGRTAIPLEFAPCGSWFVIFRRNASARPPKSGMENFPRFKPVHEVSGPWTVKFDEAWAGPASIEFPELVDWTTRPEDGVRYYSGSATYMKTFDLPAALRPADGRFVLDLGDVRELAEVVLNGRSLGVLWSMPFRVDVTDRLKPAGNRLEIKVTNFWPNRIIGDQHLSESQRLTRTNVRELTKDTPLMPSGLFGPVRLHEQQKP
ncbi:MAG TPA: glycosyl hydrolase [Opitutaceae bacterium]